MATYTNQNESWRPTMPERGTYQPPQPTAPQPRPQDTWGSELTRMGMDRGWMTPTAPPQPSFQEQRTQRAVDRTAPPRNPQEALDYQFYGAEDAGRRQEEMFNQMMEAFQRAQEASSGAWQQSQQRNEGLMREGMETGRQDYSQSQQRNEQVMREGMQTQQQDVEAARAQNQAMMRQNQAVLTQMFSLVRQGGPGSLAAITSPLGSQLAQSYNQGRWTPTDSSQFFQGMRNTPFQSGSYFQGMMGTPDPSSQYLGQMGQAAGNTQFAPPDYSAWMDPAAHRSSWYLPAPTMQTQTFDMRRPAQPQQPTPQSAPGQTTLGDVTGYLNDFYRNFYG